MSFSYRILIATIPYSLHHTYISYIMVYITQSVLIKRLFKSYSFLGTNVELMKDQQRTKWGAILDQVKLP